MALRYHGTTLLDAAAGKLPAVVLRGGAYLRHGMMGADVLANLVSAAHAKELYVILDMNTAEPECWAGYGADAVTVCPYGGSGCLEAGEMLPIAAVRTGGQVQSLVAGERGLCGLCGRGTVWMCGLGGVSVRGRFCCWRTATGRMRCRPLTIWVTGRWRQTVLCSTRRSRRRRSRRRSARGSSG